MILVDTIRSFISGERHTHASRPQPRTVDRGITSLARKFFGALTAVSGCAFVAFPNPATAMLFFGSLTFTLLTFLPRSRNSLQTSRSYAAASNLYSPPAYTVAYRPLTPTNNSNSSHATYNSSISYSPPPAEPPVLQPVSNAPAPQGQARGTLGDNGKRGRSDDSSASHVATLALQDMVAGTSQSAMFSTAEPSEQPVDLFTSQAAPTIDPLPVSQQRGNLGNDGERASERRVPPPQIAIPTFSQPAAYTSSSSSDSQSRASAASVQAAIQQSQLRGNLGNDGERASERRVPPPQIAVPTFSQSAAYTSSSSSDSQSKASAASVQAAVQQSQLRGNLGNDGERRVQSIPVPVQTYSQPSSFSIFGALSSQSRASAASVQTAAEQSQVRGSVGDNGTRSEESKKRSHDSMSSGPSLFFGAPSQRSSSLSVEGILNSSRQVSQAPTTLSGTTHAASSTASQARGEVGRREREKKEGEESQTSAALKTSDPNARGQVGRRARKDQT